MKELCTSEIGAAFIVLALICILDTAAGTQSPLLGQVATGILGWMGKTYSDKLLEKKP